MFRADPKRRHAQQGQFDLPEFAQRRVRKSIRKAPQVGLEPTTLRLTAGCSAIELLRSNGTDGDFVASVTPRI